MRPICSAMEMDLIAKAQSRDNASRIADCVHTQSCNAPSHGKVPNLILDVILISVGLRHQVPVDRSRATFRRRLLRTVPYTKQQAYFPKDLLAHTP